MRTTFSCALAFLATNLIYSLAHEARSEELIEVSQAQNLFIDYFGLGVPFSTAVIQTKQPDQAVLASTARVTMALGQSANFSVLSARLPNSAAVIHNQKRYLLHRENQPVDSEAARWASLALLSHMIGHHLLGHRPGAGDREDLQLDADRVSGFAVGRLGGTLRDATASIGRFVPNQADQARIHRVRRLDAIAAGWADARRASESLLEAGDRSDAKYCALTSSVHSKKSVPLNGVLPVSVGGLCRSSSGSFGVVVYAGQKLVDLKSAICGLTNGPRAGMSIELPDQDERPIGLPCRDGRGSSGAIVPQNSKEPESGLGGKSSTCRFAYGPKAGRAVDYAPLAPVSLGMLCFDGDGSSGIYVNG